MRGRLEPLIAASSGSLYVAGRHLAVPDGVDAAEISRRYRETIAARFLDRHPNATEGTWTRFRDALRAMLQDGDRVSDDTLRSIHILIDGL